MARKELQFKKCVAKDSKIDSDYCTNDDIITLDLLSVCTTRPWAFICGVNRQNDSSQTFKY